jgi:serine/threonine protein kinase
MMSLGASDLRSSTLSNIPKCSENKKMIKEFKAIRLAGPFFSDPKNLFQPGVTRSAFTPWSSLTLPSPESRYFSRQLNREPAFTGYNITKLLGSGAYGTVFRVSRKVNGVVSPRYALKISSNTEISIFAQKREICILKYLNELDPDKKIGIVRLISHFTKYNRSYMISECLSYNLRQCLGNDQFNQFSLRSVKCFAKQLVDILIFLSKHQVVHADLKPENIVLVDPIQNDIRLIDFGLSFKVKENIWTLVQTPCYRAPEVILSQDLKMVSNMESLGTAIDMWGVGCIIAELYTNKSPFFIDSEKEVSNPDRLINMIKVLGQPFPENFRKKYPNINKALFEVNLENTSTLREKLRLKSPELVMVSEKDSEKEYLCFVDLVHKMLTYDPEERITPEVAIKDEFFTESYQSAHFLSPPISHLTRMALKLPCIGDSSSSGLDSSSPEESRLRCHKKRRQSKSVTLSPRSKSLRQLNRKKALLEMESQCSSSVDRPSELKEGYE